MLSCSHLRRLQSIICTIENLSTRIIQQITTLQIPQEHDMRLFANLLSIFLCPHLQDVRTCMILILIAIGITAACHFVVQYIRFAPQGQLQLIPSSPINSRCTLEYGSAAIAPLKPLKKGPLLNLTSYVQLYKSLLKDAVDWKFGSASILVSAGNAHHWLSNWS